MPALSKAKNKNPFGPDQIVKSSRTFAHRDGVVHVSEQYRGDDPVVEANWTAFVPGETLDQELENPFEALAPPPQHAPEVAVQTIQIPPHRQVRCVVDVMVPVQWAPDSPGAKSGVPAPFIRSSLRIGQVLDVLSDVVRKNPSWFRWEARDVTPADIERMEKLQRPRGRRPGRQAIDRRECCGRRLTGQRLIGAHALKWLPPQRSHAPTTFSFRDPAVHRPFGLFAAAFDLLVWSLVAHPGG